MKIREILATKYVHPDVDKILKKYEKRAKGRATMGYHSMMAYPYRVEGKKWSRKYKKSIKRLLFVEAAITFHILFTNFLYK